MKNEDIELSSQLAYSIGWALKNIRVSHGIVWVGVGKHKKPFSYKDPAILWALAVAYDAFPFQSASVVEKGWLASSGKTLKIQSSMATSPEKATALAIIEASKTYRPF